MLICGTPAGEVKTSSIYFCIYCTSTRDRKISPGSVLCKDGENAARDAVQEISPGSRKHFSVFAPMPGVAKKTISQKEILVPLVTRI
jgi:hypothetical protein